MRVIPPSLSGEYDRKASSGTIWLALDSLDGDYAGVTGALTIQSTTNAAHDANIKLVIADDPGPRTGSLAPIAKSNLGTGVYQDEYVDVADYDFRGRALIGESGLTHYYIRNDWAQSGVGATPTTVTLGSSGKTFGDAVAWGGIDALSPAAGSVVWVVGDQIPVANSGWTATNISMAFVSGASAVEPTQYRFDYPGYRGCMFGGLLLGSHTTWTDDGVSPGGGTGHIWSASLPANCEVFGWVLDPGFPQGEFGEFLVRRATEADMQNNVNSHWASAYTSGTTIKLHLPAGEDPTNRVLAPILGNGTKSISNISTLTQNIVFYEVKRRMVGDITQWVVDAAKFLRGRNGAAGIDVDGAAFGSSGSLGALVYIDMDSTSRWGTAQSRTGWHIDGLRLRRGQLGLLFNRQTANGSTMDSGWYIKDVDGEEIGGHDPNYASVDGHAIAFQGGAKNITMRGSLRCYRTGGPINCYAFSQNDVDPALVEDQGFAGLDIDCTDVNIRDHSEFHNTDATGNNVGIHLTGDADIAGDHSGCSIKLSGTISGMTIGIRNKFGDQVTFDSHTNGGLLIEKGTAGAATTWGLYNQVAADISEITLSSSSGNWAAGDKLEDPDTPGNCIAIITRVIGSNPTVTLQYKYTDVNTFADLDTCANLDDTGTGTVNGAPTARGKLAGNSKYSNIKFASDLDIFYESAAAATQNGNATDKAPGLHVQANNNIYVGTTTGKFRTNAGVYHGNQDLTAWQANSDGDNQYDPDSTNPSS